MKKVLALALAVVALLCCLVGCGKKNKLVELEEYSSMTINGTTSIEVVYDYIDIEGEFTTYEFVIDDQETIEKIMTEVFNMELKVYPKNQDIDVYQRWIIIKQDNNEYHIDLTLAYEGEQRYICQSQKVRDIIENHIENSINQNNDGDTPNQLGVSFEVENVTAKGLTIHCRQSGGENVFELNTGSYFVIQKKENSNWIDVEYVSQENNVVWTTEAWAIHKEDTTTWDVDWEWLYGELSAGQYRIGKEIMNFRGTGDFDKQMVYAEFKIK